MNNLVVVKAKVFKENGRTWVTSVDVAKDYNKRHDNVLQAIQNLECSKEFRLLNFKESPYENSQGKSQPMYKMTRDGFTFLAMGFSGKKAARFKEAYINLFNQHERAYVDWGRYADELHELNKSFCVSLNDHNQKICTLEQKVYGEHESRICRCNQHNQNAANFFSHPPWITNS